MPPPTLFLTRLKLLFLLSNRDLRNTIPPSRSLFPQCAVHDGPVIVDAGSPEHRAEHRRGRPAAPPAEPANGSGRMRPLRYAMPTRSCKSLDAAGAAEGADCASCRCWGARER